MPSDIRVRPIVVLDENCRPHFHHALVGRDVAMQLGQFVHRINEPGGRAEHPDDRRTKMEIRGQFGTIGTADGLDPDRLPLVAHLPTIGD